MVYIADFLEVCPDGSVLLVEVKGRKGSGFWTLPVSKVKVRMAAVLFPGGSLQSRGPVRGSARGTGWNYD